MRNAICFLVFSGFTLFGQSASADQAAARLDSILVAMRYPGTSQPALSQQLADVMLSLAQPDHQPSRIAVAAFTDELTRALIGRGKELKWNLPPRWLLGSIQEILRDHAKITSQF